jgi:hypothetical protein
VAAPTLSGLHHLKIPVSDLDVNLDWCQRVFDANGQNISTPTTSSTLRFSPEPAAPSSSSSTPTASSSGRWWRPPGGVAAQTATDPLGPAGAVVGPRPDAPSKALVNPIPVK